MNSKRSMAVLIANLILLASCCSDSNDSVLSADNAIPEYQLSVVDSFGIEIGDSINMIGSINGFCHYHDSSVIILDRSAMKVRVIPPDGEATFWGSAGEGPGEFLLPYGICAMVDGRILVSDTYKREIMEFDITGNYTGSYMSETEESVPAEFFQVDSNSIVGSRLDVEFGEDQIQCFYYIGRFDSDCNPSVKYEEIVSDLSSADIYNKIEILEFLADPIGRVFVVSDYTEYVIKVFSDDGILEYEIVRCLDKIPKSEEEIQDEIDEFERLAVNDQAYMVGYQPIPYHRLISLVGVDGEDNLWIQRHNSENEINFDVIDPMGNLVYIVSLGNSLCDLNLMFHVDDYGILGAVVNSADYPRIFSFELDR